MVCHECDLLVDIPELEPHEKAYCPRCSYLLAANRPNAQQRMFALAVTALVFLALSTAFPFLSLAKSGVEQTITLLETVGILFSEENRVLSFIVFASIVLVPALLLLGIVYVSIATETNTALPGARTALRWVLQLAPWSMAEIFLIGILVSFVKIVSLADVALGLSFWAYTLFTICTLAVMLLIDRREIWRKLDAARA